MHRRRHNTFHYWLLCLCLSLCASSYAEDQHEAKLKRLKSNIASLQGSIRRQQNQASSLNKALRQSEQTVAQINRQLNQLKRDLRAEQQRLDELNQQRQTLTLAKKNQEQQIGSHIVTAYKLGREKRIKVLLNQEDPAKLSRALVYYDYLNRARQQHIETYESTLAQLDVIEPQILASQDALSQQNKALRAEQKKLITAQQQRSQNLAQIRADINTKQSQLSRLSADQKALEALIKSVEDAIANIDIDQDIKPFKSMKRKMPWPAKGARVYTYGKKRRQSGVRWQGNHIKNREGTEVIAIHHGRVVYSDWFAGKGLLTIVDHGHGYMSLYAHNQTLQKEPGEWVSSGEVIATMGNSGGQAEDALYFEIRSRGKPLNPKQWLR